MNAEATMENPQQTQQKAQEMLDPLSQLVRTLWLASLGAAALAAEQATRWFHMCVEKGQAVEPEVEAPFRKAREKITRTGDQLEEKLRQWSQKAQEKSTAWEARLEEKLEKVIERATQSLRDELRDLRERLERLEQTVGTPGAG